MRLVTRCPDYVVFDGFLPKSMLRDVQRYVSKKAPLVCVHAEQYVPVWKSDDGHPLRSEMRTVLEVERRGSKVAARRVDPIRLPGFYSYPSGTPLDSVLAALLRREREWRRWVGRPLADWCSLWARAYRYPAGTALSWHCDGGTYKGAFMLYIHATWDPDWGGELMIQGGGVGGAFIAPMPNRLVILKGGTPHKINRVTHSAGDTMRTTVSGFFDARQVISLLDAEQL